MDFKERFFVSSNCFAIPESVLTYENLRISVLTPCLIRVESGHFTDASTQIVQCRDFPKPAFELRERENSLLIATKKTVLCIQKGDGKFLWAKTLDCGKVFDFEGNLRGTYRTLDGANGKVKLGNGLLSKNGVAILDDSTSLLFQEDGTLKPREQCKDIYYFAYGREYRLALQDFYHLTGSTPLLPRFCFGNWWSRYWAYRQDEYLHLMEQFRLAKLPLTVATVDMDWHWVKVKKKFGKEASALHGMLEKEENYRSLRSGWTGYSWNTDLFPDYKAFLKELHDRNLKVTLNLHPADGVKFYEDAYEEMAKRMGIDPKTKKSVPFDITNPQFISAYFDVLHHGYEADGVDFWWIDWQQGTKTKVDGLDPLWALNHYHYLDHARDGHRGLILSRYAGPGSHRYPLGFSGDTIVSFASLAYQPYFTATASNIGYSWWSHDIGGHMMGIHNDELYTRWIQLGVFSPINRLHSTSDPFMGKEPWNYHSAAKKTVEEWLRFRKRLIPYLYTANYRTHAEGRALVEPMYYEHPWNENAYKVKNQFQFGSELIVSPITGKINSKTGLAGSEVFLDGETYTDIFTGDMYRMNGIVKMYRSIESIPVLAKAGAIIPLDMDDTSNGAANPENMEVLLFNGNHTYELYEDDGESLRYQNGFYALRKFSIREENGQIFFMMASVEGDANSTVQSRHFRFSFRNIDSACDFSVKSKKTAVQNNEVGYLSIDFFDVAPDDEIRIHIPSAFLYRPFDKNEKLISLISSYPGQNILKTLRFSTFLSSSHQDALLRLLPPELKGPAKEILQTI